MRIKYFSVTLILLIFLGCFPRVEAASTGSSNGEAAVANVPPKITMLLIEPNRTDTYYNITFTVRDNNTLIDLSEITVVVWDNATSSFDASNNETNHYMFKWNLSAGWFEKDLTGHLVNSTEPADLNAESAIWSIKAKFTANSVIGNYTVKIIATDKAGATGSREANLVRDGLDVVDYYVDYASQRVYVKMVYAYEGQPVNNGAVELAGLLAYTNSSGWACFDMSLAADFGYGPVAYGVQDQLYNISFKHENLTLPIAKAHFLVGCEAEPLSLSWSDWKLNVVFSGNACLNVGGMYLPTYILNAPYDLDLNFTDHLALHSGNLTVSYENWGGFRIERVTHPITSIRWEGASLTIVVSGESEEHGSIRIYVGDRDAPEKTEGFTHAYFDVETGIFTGNFTFQSDVRLIIDWATSPAGAASGGIGEAFQFLAGGTSVTAAPGETVKFDITVEFTSLRIIITAVEFSKHPEWFRVISDLPCILEGQGITTTATITVEATIPEDVPAETLTIPFMLYAKAPNGQTGAASGRIQLNIAPKPPSPPTSTILGNPFVLILLLGATAWLSYYSIRKRR